MQTFLNILPATTTESFSNRNTAPPSQPSGQAGESFDALMSRTMSPASPEKIAAPNLDGQTNLAAPGTEKRNTIPPHKPQLQPQPLSLAQIKTTKNANSIKPETDSPALDGKSGAKTDGKSGEKTTGDNSDKTHDAPVLIEAVVVPDNSQISIIQLLAPALAAWLPTAFAPALAGKIAAAADSVSVSQIETVTSTSKKISAAALTGIADTEKNPAPAAGGALGVVVPANPLITEAIPGLNADAQKKAATTSKTAFAQKIIPAETKVAGTTASAEALKLKSADTDGSDLMPQNNSAAEQSPSPEISAAPGSSKETAATTAFQIHGTPAAKLDVPMKKDDNTNKVAGPKEQVLPGKVAASAPERNSPGRGNFIAPISGGTAKADPLAAASSLIRGQTVAATSSADDTLVTSNVIDLPIRALERTHDMVSLHALRLVEEEADSLQVVIKPGAGIQLSLELRQRGDGIEAQAVLQQGDFNQLNLHWADLQQHLEQRGIRLAPLTGDENPAAFDGSNEFQKQQQRPPEEQDSLAAGAFAEFALAGAMFAPAGQLAIHAGTQHGWQTWA